MTYADFKNITYHTPLSEEVREKIAKAYARNYSTIELEDISIGDMKVLSSLGYEVQYRNKKIEIQL